MPTLAILLSILFGIMIGNHLAHYAAIKLAGRMMSYYLKEMEKDGIVKKSDLKRFINSKDFYERTK